MISLARFKNEKNIFFYFEKRHSFLEKIIWNRLLSRGQKVALQCFLFAPFFG
jgi:hypothetical protein